MLDTSLNIFHVLLVIMPGFFFLKGYGYRKSFDFEHIMYSTFWGTVFTALSFKFIPREVIQPLLENIYSASVALSVLGYFVGAFVNFLRMLPRTTWH